MASSIPMLRLRVGLLVLLAAVAQASAQVGQSNMDEAAKHFKRAEQLLDEYVNAYEPDESSALKAEMIAEVSKAIDLAPNVVEYLEFRAIYTEDRLEVIADLTRAIKLDPENPKLYSLRSEAYLDEGMEDSALNDLSKAIAVDPKSPIRYINRGRFFEKQGDRSSALADYSKAVEMDTLTPWSLEVRGLLYEKLGDFEKAIGDFNAMQDQRPDSVRPFFLRGRIYANWGECELAVKEYTKILNSKFDLDILEGHEDILDLRAKCYRILGKRELAEKDEAAARKLREQSSISN